MEFWQAVSFTETDQLIDVAKIAEEVGFTGLAISEHIVTPETITTPYPYTPDGKVWWDPNVHFPEPWALASVLATHTTTLRFITNVYILPMHDVFSAAKAVSTAAYLAKGRVILGAAVGWMKDEFLLTGQDFHTRGRRTDEMLEVMAELFRGGMVEHHGEFIDFDRVQMAPVPAERVPVYIGGDSDAALHRAARWDGWYGGGPYHPDQVPGFLARLDQARRDEGSADRPFGIILGLSTPPDLDTYKRMRDLGVTGLTNVPWYYQGHPTSTIEFKRANMESFAEQFIVPLGD